MKLTTALPFSLFWASAWDFCHARYIVSVDSLHILATDSDGWFAGTENWGVESGTLTLQSGIKHKGRVVFEHKWDLKNFQGDGCDPYADRSEDYAFYHCHLYYDDNRNGANFCIEDGQDEFTIGLDFQVGDFDSWWFDGGPRFEIFHTETELGSIIDRHFTAEGDDGRKAELHLSYQYESGSCEGVGYLYGIGDKLAENYDVDTMSTNWDPEPWITKLGSSWMSRVDDNKKLSELSIPGTHDSAARHGGPIIPDAFVVAQSWKLDEQLRAGIRYLDIRCRAFEGGFPIHHGSVYQEKNLHELLEVIRGFLNESPQETILMRVKEEYSDDAAAFGATWHRYMTELGWDSLMAKNLNQDEMPALRDVRGKVVVLRDANIPTEYGLDWGAQRVQDLYEISSQEDEEEKEREICTYIQDAKSPINKLVVNHCSGVAQVFDDEDSNWLATGWNSLNNWAYTIHDVAQTMNREAYNCIGEDTTPRSVGVIVMDFPGEELIGRIIETNDLHGGSHRKLRGEP